MSDIRVIKRHLGDGVMATYDGWAIVLHAEHDGETHWVALESSVMHELEAFARTVWAKPAEPGA